MSTAILFTQMIMIALLIVVGVISYKKQIITDKSAKNISAVIVNITNPALLVASLLSVESKISGRNMFIGLFSALLTYIFLTIIAELLPRIMRVEKSEQYCYWMLCVFANIGFIGIPLSEAVLGGEALVYVCFHNLAYSLFIYTIGNKKMMDAAGLTHKVNNRMEAFKETLKNFVNIGTITSVVTLIIYVLDIRLPDLVRDTCSYAGRSTTFLSMLVLGVSVAKMKPNDLVKNPKLLIFSIIRLTIIPFLGLMIFKSFINDELMVYTTALMLAMPAGNMPLILATEYELDAPVISDGIVLSTVLSIATIPLIGMIV